MKPEFRIREVTRFVITKHDGKCTKALVECESAQAAREILSALELQANTLNNTQPPDDFNLYDSDLYLAANVLRSNDIQTFGQLRSMSRKELSDLRGMGPKNLTIILTYLANYGIFP
jgi:DNA-directed RNA polymerase alpha subunit